MTERELHNEELSAFLYASIADIQSTIRATDTKVAALLVVLIIPVTHLDDIYKVCKKLCDHPGCRIVQDFILAGAVIFALSWILAFFASARTLMGVYNPARQVSGKTPHGSFYSGGLFRFSFLDIFINLQRRSKTTLESHITNFPKVNAELVAELTFEQMKLAYIRDVKGFRQTAAFACAIAWIIFGACGWMCALFLGL